MQTNLWADQESEAFDRLTLSECRDALRRITAALEAETGDPACFLAVEEIVCALESIGAAPSRHDFG